MILLNADGFFSDNRPQLGEKRLTSGSSFLICMMRLIVPSVVSSSSSAPASDNTTLSAADVRPAGWNPPHHRAGLGRSSTTISRSPTFLGHGADISTHWVSHELASILHELVWHEDYEAMQLLIDCGIDMTIDDYRWGGTAQGWAYHAAKDERMALWLAEAQRQWEHVSH